MKRVIRLVSVMAFAFAMTLTGCKNQKQSETQSAAVTTTDSVKVETAEQALAMLIEGNKRFVEGKQSHPHCTIERVKETSEHQEPFATIIGCADSRSPVELIFDQGLGDLFIIRSAGNLVKDDIIQGSLDYSVDHLGVKLVVVLGHTHCGGITSAVCCAHHEESAEAHVTHGKLDQLVASIQEDVKDYVGSEDKVEEAVVANIKVQVERVSEVEYIKELIAKNELQVVGALYDIATGEVTFLN